MYIYGAVAALVGKPTKPKLICNFVRKKDGHDQPIEILKNKSFSEDIDLRKERETQATLNKFLGLVQEVIRLQKSQPNSENITIPVIVGGDARNDYKNIANNMLTNFFAVAQNKFNKKTCDEFFKKISLRWGGYNEIILGEDGSHQAVDVDKVAHLKQIIAMPQSKKHNEILAGLKDRITNNDEEAINEACKMAQQIGKFCGIKYKNEPDMRFAFNMGIYRNAAKSLDPNDLHIFDYVSWHPKIKQAFQNGHSEVRGPMQVVVKGLSEDPSPPFVDILGCYIQDQFQGLGNLQSASLKSVATLIETLVRSLFK